MLRAALLLATVCAVTACNTEPRRTGADVIVIGAGIAGISAALEASASGASVLIVEQSSVAGGHAVRAGGFAMVDTPLQRKKGIEDSPDLAVADLLAWGEDADPAWVTQFAERSSADVYDWLTGFGVRFNILLDTPEGSVPRFHFAGGPAINVIVPLLREAFTRDNIHWVMNARAGNIFRTDDGLLVVRTVDTRNGQEREFAAAAIILATGGFQSNLELVRANWHDGIEWPDRILLGVGPNAMGDGLRLGADLGAAVTRLDAQVTFVNGLPNPRMPHRSLHVSNSASIWIDADGQRFVNEAAPTKLTESAVLASNGQTFWMVFDAQGLRRLRIRDAEWLKPDTISAEILDNPDVAGKAATLTELAEQVGLPANALEATINRYNGFIAAGEDKDFNRFSADSGPKPKPIEKPPFHALQLFPMTRKNLGGLAVDIEAQVVDAAGEPVPGLLAAGESTGVAAINGRYGGSGTFLAPAVLMGRIAGRKAADRADRSLSEIIEFIDAEPGPRLDAGRREANDASGWRRARDGYRHFEDSHRVVSTRNYACDYCHTDDWPAGPVSTRQARIARLESCTSCH
ncbi:MAG: FAD-dependent oxidoreductase [Gammaproteobacteria bacterium]